MVPGAINGNNGKPEIIKELGQAEKIDILTKDLTGINSRTLFGEGLRKWMK